MLNIFPCSDRMTSIVADLSLRRRFEIVGHPRFEQIITKRSALRFAANSDLPDPYDGLIDAG